jgi:UPF0755 protein
MHKMMKRLLFAAVIIFAAFALLAWLGVWLSTPVTEDAASFVVGKGENTDLIVAHLKEQGVIRSEFLFRRVLASSGLATSLQPGTYDLRGARNFTDIITRLTSGGVPADEFVLLVKEGWNLSDIRKALLDDGFKGGDLYSVTGVPGVDARTHAAGGAPPAEDFSTEFPFLNGKPAYVSLEGFLFPDTYRIYRDATAEDVVRKLLGNFDEKLTADLRAKIAAQGRTIYDVVTMASIIEREVRTDDDRRMVADIFWRRVAAGMPLQADSTVNYATGKGMASVSYEDTKNVSPYNTYKYPGLPLGPICNPGLDAIEAAITPTPNQYWYFLTDANGAVHYAKTLDEQNRNKAEYLQ